MRAPLTPVESEAGSVALAVGKIEADLSSETFDPSSPVDASEVDVRWIPVPTRGDRPPVRWYLRFNLPYRDVEELLVERGIEVDHVTVYRWVQRFTPVLADTGPLPPPLTGR